MPIQTLGEFERRFRLFETRIGANIEKRVRLIEEHFEEKVERPFRRIERKVGQNIGKRVRLIEEHFEEKVERPFRRIEQKIGANIGKRVRLIEERFEEKVERPFRRIEQKIGHNIETGIRRFEQKVERPFRLIEQKIGRNIDEIETRIRRIERKRIDLNDEVRFIGSWIKKPLDVGAVAPSSKLLARTMAGYVDPNGTGPVIELGPGTGPITEALVEHGVDPARLVLLEYNPAFCELLRRRFPAATVIQGDAYSLRNSLAEIARHEAAAIVSGLPLMTKPLPMRLRLLREAFALLKPDAPFVQFTYAVVPPIPRMAGMAVEASERIWLNLPPARVWVYRHA
jgi:phosphatidylethanolamine/phosphatidyl-N-methylethanolamine N-methyltransferase